MKKKILAGQNDIDCRLDNALAKHLPDFTRSQVKKWIDNGWVKVGAEIKKTSYKVKKGDEIEVTVRPPKESAARPQKIPLEIIFEDSDIIVINKPANMVVHPAAGNPDGTLVNALLYHCKDLSGIGGILRPGIVHRLDKGTSGVIVAAKNDFAHLRLSEQFKGRRVEKIYNAIIYGHPKAKEGTFDLEIGRSKTHRKKMSTRTRRGKSAVTHWKVTDHFDKHISVVRIRLVTGRTHQIRVHFSAYGMPLVGDMIYGGKRTVKRLPEGEYREVALRAGRPMLHAVSITIRHPRDGRTMKFEAVFPDDFREILEGFRAIS